MKYVKFPPKFHVFKLLANTQSKCAQTDLFFVCNNLRDLMPLKTAITSKPNTDTGSAQTGQCQAGCEVACRWCRDNLQRCSVICLFCGHTSSYPGPPVGKPVTCKTLPTWSTWPTDGKEPEAKSVAAHRRRNTMTPLIEMRTKLLFCCG